jgi:hypothetical protein
MNYFVVVNNKYIINVSADSACAAEHAILDQYAGTQYAQAFTVKELNTDTFKHFMEVCETISAKELMEKSDEYADKMAEAAAARMRCDDLCSEITQLIFDIKQQEEKLKRLKEEREEESKKTMPPELI